MNVHQKTLTLTAENWARSQLAFLLNHSSHARTHTHTHTTNTHSPCKAPTVGDHIAGSLGWYLSWPLFQFFGVDHTIKQLHHLLRLDTGKVQIGVPAA